jgi:glycopeptide antibiotics resistance protein
MAAVASRGQWQVVQRYVAAGYALVLAVVSLMPGPRIPAIFDWSSLFSPDKAAHFVAYAVFALLLSPLRGSSSWRKRTMVAVICAAAYGVLMEVLQGIAGTGRHFDPVDMVANLIGAILGGLIYAVFLNLAIRYFASARF